MKNYFILSMMFFVFCHGAKNKTRTEKIKESDKTQKNTEHKLKNSVKKNIIKFCDQNKSASETRERFLLANSEDLIEFLDNITFCCEKYNYELNECKPVQMDINSLDEYLWDTQDVVSSEVINFNADNQTELTETQLYINDPNYVIINYNDNSENPKSCDEERRKNIELEVNIHFDKSFEILNNKISHEEIKLQIYNLAVDNKSVYKSIYKKRLDDISDVYDNFYEYKHEKDNNYKSLFVSLNNNDDIYKLNKIVSNFNENLKLNKKNCNKLIKAVESEIFNDERWTDVDSKVTKTKPSIKKFIYFSEIMKLYKYVPEIPELLTLGSLFSYKANQKTTILVQKINLFLENIGDLEKKRFFIISMIFDAYKICVDDYLIDISKFSNLKLVCKNKQHDFNYFLWELDVRKRSQLIKRKYSMCYTCEFERVDFKNILLRHLYQYTIFIKYYNVSLDTCRLFYIFCRKVIDSEECIDLLLKEFLNQIEMINREVFMKLENKDHKNNLCAKDCHN